MILLPGPPKALKLHLKRVEKKADVCPEFRMWLEPCLPKSLEMLLELKEVTPFPQQSPLLRVLLRLLHPGPLKLVEFSVEGWEVAMLGGP